MMLFCLSAWSYPTSNMKPEDRGWVFLDSWGWEVHQSSDTTIWSSSKKNLDDPKRRTQKCNCEQLLLDWLSGLNTVSTQFKHLFLSGSWSQILNRTGLKKRIETTKLISRRLVASSFPVAQRNFFKSRENIYGSLPTWTKNVMATTFQQCSCSLRWCLASPAVKSAPENC